MKCAREQVDGPGNAAVVLQEGRRICINDAAKAETKGKKGTHIFPESNFFLNMHFNGGL
jgi:hypothetical protein